MTPEMAVKDFFFLCVFGFFVFTKQLVISFSFEHFPFVFHSL